MGDWLNALTILAIGVFIGLALESLFQLKAATFWIFAIATPVAIAVFFLLVEGIDKLFDRLFPAGFKKSSTPKVKEPRPIALLLSLPVGIAIGVIGAQFGLTDVLL